MMKNNPYQAYKQQSVMTMTPGDMLNTVYDALCKQMNLAKAAFADKDYAAVNRTLQKAQSILSYLKSTLDFEYPIANDLGQLYDYFINCLLQANLRKDPSELDDIIQMVVELQQTYVEADRKSRRMEAIG